MQGRKEGRVVPAAGTMVPWLAAVWAGAGTGSPMSFLNADFQLTLFFPVEASDCAFIKGGSRSGSQWDEKGVQGGRA